MGKGLKVYIRFEVLILDEKEEKLDATEVQLDKEYLEQKEAIRLKRLELMENKLMGQRFSDQALDAKYVRRAASDSSMPGDVQSFKHGKYTTSLYHD